MKHRIANSDKVEIIDKNHRYFGEKGTVIELECKPLKILKNPEAPSVLVRVVVKLERFNETVGFSNYPQGLGEQIKKV